jgi:hypothetical protein
MDNTGISFDFAGANYFNGLPRHFFGLFQTCGFSSKRPRYLGAAIFPENRELPTNQQ